MKVLIALFCNDTVVSWADARFEFLTALAIKLGARGGVVVKALR
jgi:hypothetical protein